MNINQDLIKDVVVSLEKGFSDELFSKTSEQLEEYWHFKWNDKRSIEANLYEFFDLLGLYERQCTRWEEHHNGICCVVERVRDAYLMPKIKQLASNIKQNPSLKG